MIEERDCGRNQPLAEARETGGTAANGRQRIAGRFSFDFDEPLAPPLRHVNPEGEAATAVRYGSESGGDGPSVRQPRHPAALRLLACALIAMLSFGALGWPEAARAAGAPQVWYSPDEDSADLLEMFARPELWSHARSRIAVFNFGPHEVQGKNPSGLNTSMDLQRVDAFRKLGSWGIQIAISAPAVKGWDCTGQLEIKRTLQYIATVRRAGGTVSLLDLDEPLVGGVVGCRDSAEAVADKLATYFARVGSAEPGVQIGDIETYPGFGVARTEQFIELLARRGVRPAFVQLDINFPVLRLRPQLRPAADLRALQTFFRQQRIPFGVIIWSGYNPVRTDRAYFEDAMGWARWVHAAAGMPDQLIIASWVTRSGQRCMEGQRGCTPIAPGCIPDDGPLCGRKSVPLNLPDEGRDAFTLTRLVLAALREFGMP